MGPPIEWSFGDILPGQHIDINVGRPFKGINIVPGQSGLFTPGFDASRSADNTIFTQTGTQTLTIAVTPRQAMPRLDISVWAGNTGNVISTIVSPTTDNSKGIYLAEGGQNLSINIQNPVVGTTYTYQVISQVTPLVPQVEFMPNVGVAWWDVNLASGIATGSSFSRTVPGLGTWTWSAAGDYSWQWGEDLNRSVQLMGYSNVPPSVSPITLNPSGVSPVGTMISASVGFTDPTGQAGGPYAVSVNWGDGTEPTNSIMNTPGAATLSHTYSTAGAYTIMATVTDGHGRSSSSSSQTFYVYQPTQFVVWGGNIPNLADAVKVGQNCTFWGAQWAKQVTAGDFHANASFKGYADQVSSYSWTSNPSNASNPPASVASYISVIVSTQIAKNGNIINGNIAEVVVLRVDNPASYQPNPGHPGSGVAVAIVQ